MQEFQPRIESAVALVDSIEQTRTRFEDMGYAVIQATLGLGTNTRQCFVPFADGTGIHFIERPRGILARVRRRRTLSPRFRRKTQTLGKHALRFRRILSFEQPRPGLIDAVLRVPEHPQFIQSQSAGAQAVPADWIEAETSYSIGDETTATTLLVPNRQPRELPLVRVSETALPFAPASTDHPNGVQGIFHLQIGVQDLDAARPVYTELLGTDPYDHVDPVQRRAIFNLENGEIELMPVDTSLEAGIREISLRPGFPGHRVSYDPERTHGIAMRVTDISAKAALEPDEDEELERTGISRSRRK